MPDFKRILIGDNPFIGVNHLSQERLRESRHDLDSRSIASIINRALDAGADGFVCSVHPNNKAALDCMRGEENLRRFGVHAIVPDAQTYVRLVSESGMVGLLKETFGSLTLRGKARVVVNGGFSVLGANPTKALNLLLETELALFSKSLPKNAEIQTVFLHELVTELIVSFELSNLARNYIDFARRSLGIAPGFVTRNFSRFVEFAVEAELPLKEFVVLAPFNRAGFQMNPTRRECESKLKQVRDLDVVAMSVLAAGYSDLDDAIDYLLNLGTRVSCVVGVSTEKQAGETFERFKSASRRPNTN